MEQNNKFPVILIIGIVLVACIGIIGVGFASYYLVDTYLPELISSGQVDVDSEADFPDTSSNDDNPNEQTNPDVIEDEPLEESILPPQSDSISEGLFAPFWESRELLNENFVEQPIDDYVLAEGAVEGLEMLLEEHDLSLASVEASPSEEQIEDLGKQAETPREALDAFLPLWEAWAKLSALEVPEELNETQFMRAALQGMMLSLDDPYTGYLDPEISRQWDIDLSGEYEGIGAWVDTTAEYLTIISPIPGSPAEAAGLQAGDRVIAIDGDDMTGIDGSIVIQRVLVPAGSTVVLTIERDDVEDPFDVTIVRARITIPNVDYEILENDIAYLQLFTFSETAHRDLADALEELLAEEPVGLILDLRGNGGGYLHIAVNITSEFIESGVLLYEEYGDGTRDIHEARSSVGLATEIPMVVLINAGSASASEILAGAIQDYERGLLVGTTSFGKGSVQIPVDLRYDEGSVRITIARWLTPNENHIQNIGLEPDVYVELTEEQYLAGEDPQLDEAIQVLLEQIQ
jgi:carboxyl-terminal processing protease